MFNKHLCESNAHMSAINYLVMIGSNQIALHTASENARPMM
jgi:hypothetical protein